MQGFFLTGKLTNKVVFKTTEKKGKKIEFAYFTILTDGRYKDRNGFYQIVWCWYNDARELMNKNLVEGDHLYVEGYLSLNSQKALILNASTVKLVYRPNSLKTEQETPNNSLENSGNEKEDQNPLDSEELSY